MKHRDALQRQEVIRNHSLARTTHLYFKSFSFSSSKKITR